MSTPYDASHFDTRFILWVTFNVVVLVMVCLFVWSFYGVLYQMAQQIDGTAAKFFHINLKLTGHENEIDRLRNLRDRGADMERRLKRIEKALGLDPFR